MKGARNDWSWFQRGWWADPAQDPACV